MDKELIQKDENYMHDKQVMMRYVTAYAKKNGEKALNEEQVEDILTGLIAIAQAFLSGNPRRMARALIELGHLAKKYGAKLIEKLYHNYRERQRRREKENGKQTALPTEKKLQKFLAEHADKDEKTLAHGDLKKFFQNQEQKSLAQKKKLIVTRAVQEMDVDVA